MANLRAIRMRIKSVESTRQITRSMKMVAAAKLRKTQGAYTALRRYSEQCQALLQLAAPEGDSPLLRLRREEPRRCYVLIPGNRGLCGTYNQNLLRFAQEQMEPGSLLVCCGRWGREQIGPVERFFPISDAPDSREARALAEYLRDLVLEDRVDQVVLLYQGYTSVLQQSPKALVLLPMSLPRGEKTDCIFEPDRASLQEELLNLSLVNTLHAVLLEARTGEHSARMTAMTAAADNTEELIGELTLQLNHARQAAITTEISEIVGGTAAL